MNFLAAACSHKLKSFSVNFLFQADLKGYHLTPHSGPVPPAPRAPRTQGPLSNGTVSYKLSYGIMMDLPALSMFVILLFYPPGRTCLPRTEPALGADNIIR